ncbi:hypothetical protein HDU85_001633 [Gaertneriomyces sp. JEL0708]|nr:hypothetical protein HDU85_001633 [Gaertneriomyces sp. JEL0708]
MKPQARANLHKNIAVTLKLVKDTNIRTRFLAQCYAVSPAYAEGIHSLLPADRLVNMNEVAELAKQVQLERDSETDLIVSYISLIINEILSGDERIRPVWANTTSCVSAKEAIKRGRRPDFKLVRVHQGREDAESGFAEVEPTGCKDDTYMLNLDLIRIGRFGKCFHIQITTRK